jgi:hypothetical protein
MLKDTGTVNWWTANGTNSSRFTAVGGGFRNYFDSSFEGRHTVAYLWTSTAFTPYATKYHRWMSDGDSKVYEYLDQPTQGMSVRCVQDTITTGGIKDINNSNWLVFYPNPSKDYITIENIEHTDALIEISGLEGQFITSFTIKANKTILDVSDLPNGVYVVEMKTKTGVTVKKFVKE